MINHLYLVDNQDQDLNYHLIFTVEPRFQAGGLLCYTAYYDKAQSYFLTNLYKTNMICKLSQDAQF